MQEPRDSKKTDNNLSELGWFHIFSERLSSGIAGWRGGWVERIGSEGARPALLPAGPVPERWNVKLVFIETPHGPAINWTSSLGLFLFFQAFKNGSRFLIWPCLQPDAGRPRKSLLDVERHCVITDFNPYRLRPIEFNIFFDLLD